MSFMAVTAWLGVRGNNLVVARREENYLSMSCRRSVVVYIAEHLSGYRDNGSDSKSPIKDSHRSAFYQYSRVRRHPNNRHFTLPFTDGSSYINSFIFAH